MDAAGFVPEDDTVARLSRLNWENPYQDNRAAAVQGCLVVHGISNKRVTYFYAETEHVRQALGVQTDNPREIRNALQDELGSGDVMFYDLQRDETTIAIMFVSVDALHAKGIKPSGSEDYLSAGCVQDSPGCG